MPYFDHHLSTFTSSSVIHSVSKVWSSDYASPLSPHFKGQSLLIDMERAYQNIFSLLGANPTDWSLFVFPSHEEAVHQVFWSTYFNLSRYSGRNHFLLSRFGETSADFFTRRLCDLGAHVTQLDPHPDTGCIDLELLKKHHNIKTCLLSLSWAHGITGLIQPLESIGHFCKEKGIFLYVDGSYIAGKIPIKLQESSIDFFTLNGEQIHGPKASGLLLVRKPLRLEVLFMRQRDYSLTDPSVLIGLGEAAQEASSHRLEWSTDVARLRNKFEKGIQEGNSDCKPLFTERKRLPNRSVVLFPHVQYELLSYELNQKGIYVSPSPTLSEFLKKQRLIQNEPPGAAYSALSFSFVRNHFFAEIEESYSIITKIFSHLQSLAPC